MLDYINTRVQLLGIESVGASEKNNPARIYIHEKERQFMEAFKLLIQSGHTVNENEFL